MLQTNTTTALIIPALPFIPALEKVKQIYDGLRGISCDESPRVSAFPGRILHAYFDCQSYLSVQFSFYCQTHCVNIFKSPLSFPLACSLSGYPSGQRWFFAIQAVHGFGQVTTKWYTIIESQIPSAGSYTPEHLEKPLKSVCGYKCLINSFQGSRKVRRLVIPLPTEMSWFRFLTSHNLLALLLYTSI